MRIAAHFPSGHGIDEAHVPLHDLRESLLYPVSREAAQQFAIGLVSHVPSQAVTAAKNEQGIGGPSHFLPRSPPNANRQRPTAVGRDSGETRNCNRVRDALREIDTGRARV